MPLSVAQIGQIMEAKGNAVDHSPHYPTLASISEGNYTTRSLTALGKRLSHSKDDQMRVGAYAASANNGIVNDNTRIFIGSGAATYYFFLNLATIERDVEVFTNNMLIAANYSRFHSTIKKLTVLGTGEVDRGYGHVNVKDDVLKDAVKDCGVAVVSPTLFDSDFGPSTTSADTREARRIILQTASRVVFLADRNKLAIYKDDVAYDYEYQEDWSKQFEERKDRFTLITTCHLGIPAAGQEFAGRSTAAKEPGEGASYHTYCKNSFDFHSKLGDRFIELQSE
ncbi:MAG: hypothetical protein AAGJ54_10860 [Planctomycetota bacterium]